MILFTIVVGKSLYHATQTQPRCQWRTDCMTHTSVKCSTVKCSTGLTWSRDEWHHSRGQQAQTQAQGRLVHVQLGGSQVILGGPAPCARRGRRPAGVQGGRAVVSEMQPWVRLAEKEVCSRQHPHVEGGAFKRAEDHMSPQLSGPGQR